MNSVPVPAAFGPTTRTRCCPNAPTCPYLPHPHHHAFHHATPTPTLPCTCAQFCPTHHTPPSHTHLHPIPHTFPYPTTLPTLDTDGAGGRVPPLPPPDACFYHALRYRTYRGATYHTDSTWATTLLAGTMLYGSGGGLGYTARRAGPRATLSFLSQTFWWCRLPAAYAARFVKHQRGLDLFTTPRLPALQQHPAQDAHLLL